MSTVQFLQLYQILYVIFFYFIKFRIFLNRIIFLKIPYFLKETKIFYYKGLKYLIWIFLFYFILIIYSHLSNQTDMFIDILKFLLTFLFRSINKDILIMVHSFSNIVHNYFRFFCRKIVLIRLAWVGKRFLSIYKSSLSLRHSFIYILCLSLLIYFLLFLFIIFCLFFCLGLRFRDLMSNFFNLFLYLKIYIRIYRWIEDIFVTFL